MLFKKKKKKTLIAHKYVVVYFIPLFFSHSLNFCSAFPLKQQEIYILSWKSSKKSKQVNHYLSPKISTLCIYVYMYIYIFLRYTKACNGINEEIYWNCWLVKKKKKEKKKSSNKTKIKTIKLQMVKESKWEKERFHRKR